MNLFLHIGPDKTGTTTIQKFLDVNRAKLANKGYLVPKSPGLQRHFKLYLYGFDDNRMVAEPAWNNRKVTPQEFREEFKADLAEEVSKSKARFALMSDEGLFRLSADEVKRLHELLSGVFKNIYIVLYLRRQDQHVLSRYQQIIKTGASTITLSEYLRGKHPYYLYAEILKRWADCFERRHVQPRIFDRSLFVGGSLLTDYLDAVQIKDTSSFETVESQNVGLDAASTEFLRLYKLAYRKATGEDLHPLRQDIDLIRFLEERSNGERLIMADKRRERFMARWNKTNASVARLYFGREDGKLFPDVEPKNVDKLTRPLTLDDSLKFFYDAWATKSAKTTPFWVELGAAWDDSGTPNTVEQQN